MLTHICIFIFAIIPSSTLLILIGKYHMEKPPGLQTILDLLVSDSVTLFHAFNLSTALVFCLIEIASIHSQVPFIWAQLVQFLFTNCLVLFLASLQVRGTYIYIFFLVSYRTASRRSSRGLSKGNICAGVVQAVIVISQTDLLRTNLLVGLS